jgi:hypothetical protein
MLNTKGQCEGDADYHDLVKNDHCCIEVAEGLPVCQYSVLVDVINLKYLIQSN